MAGTGGAVKLRQQLFTAFATVEQYHDTLALRATRARLASRLQECMARPTSSASNTDKAMDAGSHGIVGPPLAFDQCKVNALLPACLKAWAVNSRKPC